MFGARFGTPLFFGVAHVHHLLAGVPPAVVLLQLGYTTVFGAYVTFAFDRTGSIAGPVLCHAFSNWMGFPDFGAVATHPRRALLTVAYVAGLCGFLGLLSTL